MNHTKKRYGIGSLILASALALLAASLAIPVKADIGSPTSFGCTNAVSSNATFTSAVNVGTSIKIAQQDNVAVCVAFQGTGSDTSDITYTFARSVDDSNWETVPKFTWIVPLNNTTAVVAITNLGTATIGAAGYLKVLSIQNAATGVSATNHSVKILKKTIKASP